MTVTTVIITNNDIHQFEMLAGAIVLALIGVAQAVCGREKLAQFTFTLVMAFLVVGAIASG